MSGLAHVTTALRKAKIVYNFGLSGFNRFNGNKVADLQCFSIIPL